MVYEIKRLSVWSVAKVSFVLGGLFGFLMGLLFWMFAGLLAQTPLSEFGDVEGLNGFGAMGAMLPFLMAVFYAVAAMLFNGLMAGVYNVLSGVVGGIECTLAVPVSPYAMAPPQAPPSLPQVVPPPAPPPPGHYGAPS